MSYDPLEGAYEDLALIKADLHALVTFVTELRDLLIQVSPMLAMLAPGAQIPALDVTR